MRAQSCHGAGKLYHVAPKMFHAGPRSTG